jgi:hypothetical protein
LAKATKLETTAKAKAKPTKTVHTGGCLCGHIRFEAEGLAASPHTCSCTMCQRHSGAPTLAWVVFPKPKVTWTGPGGAPSTWRASDISSRAFCPTCGSTLGAIDDAPTIGLVTGVFDAPNAKDLVPASHSFKGRRPRWWHVRIDGE